MELRSERFDESSLPEAHGRRAYEHTGTTYFVTADGTEYVFSADDEAPTVARLMVPRAWLIDELVAGDLGRAIDYLGAHSPVEQVELGNRMSHDATLVLRPGTNWREAAT
jgi:hypothetical protein